MCSQVAQTGSCFGGSEEGLIYVGSGLDLDLHMSCGKETLAGPNRFELSYSSVMESRSSDLHRS
jgi:hypothetical protein